MPHLTIALSSPAVATSIDDGLSKIENAISVASDRGAEVICFPEAYLPGLRGQDFDVLPWEVTDQERVLTAVADLSRAHSIVTILGIERITDAGRQIAASVFGADGAIQGFQTKNQLDPTEDRFYVAGTARQLFDVKGTKFGIAICHEGWRYPETVRWAASRGARIVFHPQLTGTHRGGVKLTTFGSPDAPYYEKAMLMRSIENTIYFASVNYALPFQESATAVIGPQGVCEACLPYGEEGVLLHTIDLDAATGLLAKRFAPERHV